MDIKRIMAEEQPEKIEIGSYFLREFHGQWLALGMLSLLLVAVVYYVTVFKLRLTVAYLLPLLIFTWVTGRLFGIMLAIVAFTCWAYLDVTSGHYTDHPALLYWDWG